MCGYQIIEIPSANDGRIDLDALRSAVGDDTVAMMITNPSTLGVFEPEIAEATGLYILLVGRCITTVPTSMRY